MGVTATTTGGLVSDEARYVFQWICYAVVCEVVDIFGTGTNIVNVVCFVKQGFKDPINVTLLGLALSDLGCLVTLIWTNICFNPLFYESVQWFDSIEISYLTAGWPHVMFTRITSLITALITLERCLCITMPLKVKDIVTPKRATIAIITVFVVLICGISPVYYANRFASKFFKTRNKTMIGLVYTADRAKVEEITFAITNVFIPLTAFLIIIFCTIILVVQLHNKTKWRAQSIASEKANVMSDRDQKVAKMVVMISSLFIACFIPICLTFIAIILVPELTISGRYRNTLFILSGISFLLESLNSSTNIFIYYKMSSKYRHTFHQIFPLCGKQQKQ